MKYVYCAKCGAKLEIIRKAIPHRATIVDIVAYHECKENVEEPTFNYSETPVPVFGENKDNEKFVSKLNDLKPETVGKQLKDRRFETEEHVKSTAPQGVLGMMDSLAPTTPRAPLVEPEGSKDE